MGVAGVHAASMPLKHIAETVSEIFSIVTGEPERKWAYDFVMDNSPETNLQVFSNRSALPFVTGFSGTDICFQSDCDEQGFFDYRFDVDVIMVPFFSAKPLTVGTVFSRSTTGSVFEQKESRFAPNNPDSDYLQVSDIDEYTDLSAEPFAYNFRLGRYVRDDVDGRVLFILHSCIPFCALNSTQVVYLQHVSPTKSKRVSLSCETDLFLSGKIVESISMCMTKFFTRNCPMCGCPPSSKCQCSFPSRLPAHPFDFRGDPSAFKLHTGTMSSGFGNAKIVALSTPDISASSILQVYLKPLEANSALSQLSNHNMQARKQWKFTHAPVLTRSHIRWDTWCPTASVTSDTMGKLCSALHEVAMQMSLSMVHPCQISGTAEFPALTCPSFGADGTEEERNSQESLQFLNT